MNATLAAERWPTAILPRATLLQRDWSFRPGRPSPHTQLSRLRARRCAIPFPDHRVHRAIVSAPRWNCLFLFCPGGTLDPVQQELLAAARALRGRLLVVIALPPGWTLPGALDVADAIVSKSLPGFDFAAYALALTLVAERSPGALAYVQNDSVFGPVVPLDPLIDAAPWDLTGFIASPVMENHLSSFAFVLRAVTPERVAALAPALTVTHGYDDFTAVVALQETRLARLAARRMSVGSYWYMADAPPAPSLTGAAVSVLRRRRPAVPFDLRGDPALGLPIDLLDQGFPFVKRSLFGKFAGAPFTAALADRLRVAGWPSNAA